MSNLGFISENQPWVDLTKSNNLSGESSKKKLEMKPMNQKEGAPANRKRSRGGVTISSDQKKNVTNGEGKDGKYRDSDHEMHIWTERERRKKMRNMFSSLHALLPQLPSKADKSTIVDAAITHIKDLQEILEKLENKKQEKLKTISPLGCESSSVMNSSQWQPNESREAFIADHQGSSNAFSTVDPPQQVAFQTWSSQNVVLNICGGQAQFSICATKKTGLLTTIAFVLEKHRIDVISANIWCNGNGNFYMILAHAKQGSDKFQDANSVEEIFKKAAGEIMMWIS